MRTLIGRVIQFLGWALVAWSGVVGLSFTGVFLVGFVGTQGREAGHDLLLALAFTAVVPALGYGIARFGKYLARREATLKA